MCKMFLCGLSTQFCETDKNDPFEWPWVVSGLKKERKYNENKRKKKQAHQMSVGSKLSQYDLSSNSNDNVQLCELFSCHMIWWPLFISIKYLYYMFHMFKKVNVHEISLSTMKAVCVFCLSSLMSCAILLTFIKETLVIQALFRLLLKSDFWHI